MKLSPLRQLWKAQLENHQVSPTAHLVQETIESENSLHQGSLFYYDRYEEA